MSEYQFKGMGNALPYNAYGFAVLQRRVNVPKLIATDYGFLALASAPTIGLSSFAGFATDTLNLFHIPAGTWVLSAGCRIVVPGTDNVDARIGDGADDHGWMAAATPMDAIADTVVNTIAGAGNVYGPDYMQGKVYNADDTIDCIFATATDILGVYDFFAVCAKVY
jgi:hypothetical protein